MPDQFDVYLTESAGDLHDRLASSDRARWRKINKALKLLAADPKHPSLAVHKYDDYAGAGPSGEDIWIAYIENHTPGAWRLLFYYDRKVRGRIIVTRFEAHY